ncbi:MAG: response regulator [Betaproteobacteria bacterium]|nr:response regulator [Betaproteobacteria bacterium]
MGRSVQSVLIIEDEPILAKNIGTYLRRYAYEVRIASSAEAGLSELEAFKPDAILLDFNLPGMNGLEALPKIRAIDRHIKIIMMTAYGSNELAVDAMQGGACLFVRKPISVAKVKQLLEEVTLDEPADQARS